MARDTKRLLNFLKIKYDMQRETSRWGLWRFSLFDNITTVI